MIHHFKIGVLSALIALGASAHAQLVDIPDTDLQAHLQSLCGCVVAGQIDAATWVAPAYLPIPTDIAQDGVLDLSGLEQLVIPSLDITSTGVPLETVLLPGFPMGLEGLNMDPDNYARLQLVQRNLLQRWGDMP